MKVLFTIGTRPELIKLAPVVKEAKRSPLLDVRVVFTAQHRGLLDQMAEFFGIEADDDLDMMQPGQSLAALTGRMVPALDAMLEKHEPDVVIAQGDTTTVLSTAIAAYYRQIPFGHVEAGLRSGDIFAPFPEEGNRKMVGALTKFHFAPTQPAADNLLAEGVDTDDVYVTGNPVVDALYSVADRPDLTLPPEVDPNRPLVLVTVHRRESFGEPADRILGALREIALSRPDAQFLYPIHPNPRIRDRARAALADLDNMLLVEPLDYGTFVHAMQHADLILTDSGGVQEEAPTFGTPLLVLREVTERPEGVEAGVAELVGTDAEKIVSRALSLLTTGAGRRFVPNPYGDGMASVRIRNILDAHARGERVGDDWSDQATSVRTISSLLV